MSYCKFVFYDPDNLIAGMYSLDTVVLTHKKRFCEKVVLDVKKMSS